MVVLLLFLYLDPLLIEIPLLLICSMRSSLDVFPDTTKATLRVSNDKEILNIAIPQVRITFNELFENVS
uniref:hypothetical protein n=1 Tax=Candidatus Limisoma sp. TaxID=3076476 RepID=UPI004029F732